jgi:DNA-binding LacI/PurR family transcriptional regulator
MPAQSIAAAECKFRHVRDALLVELKKGVYEKTLRLPSERELIDRFGVARETVRKALAELERTGFVQRRKGIGTFVTRRGKRRSGVIGLLIPDISSARIFNDFVGEIGRLAARNGYEVAVRDFAAGKISEMKNNIRRIARELVVQNVEGVIFRPFIDERLSASNREIVKIFKNAETPVVLIDSDVVESPERSECDLVAIDNVSAGRRVAKHLLERGYRKIGFMMNGTVLRSNVNWRNRLFGVAGEMALREIEYAVRPLDFKPGCQLDLKKLYRSDFQPDAIVCGNDETAVQLMKSLLAIGKRIPEDVAVVGFDDADIASSFKIPLTTVRQPSKLIAKSVLTTLLARIAHPANNPREILVSAPLVIRMSS